MQKESSNGRNHGSENPLLTVREHHPRDRTRLIVGMVGLLGFGFGFSFQKIGVLVAIALQPLQLNLLLVSSLVQHRKA